MGSLGLGDGSLRMDDVYLEGATPEGPAVVGHLSVIVDTEGITFLGPEPGERRTVGWDRTSPLEFGPPAALPGGQAVTSLEFAVDGRQLRLLVPSKRDPAGVEAEAEVPPVAESPAPVLAEPAVAPVVAPVVAPALAPMVEPAVAPVVAPVAESPAPVLAEPPAAPVVAPVAESPAPVLAAADPSVYRARGVAGGPDGRGRSRPTTTRCRLRPGSGSGPTPVARSSPAGPPCRPPSAWSGSCSSRSSWGSSPWPRASGTSTSSRSRRNRGRVCPTPPSPPESGSSRETCPGGAPQRPGSGNPFAAGATSHGVAALRTAEQASTVLARCLHVPVSAVDGAFGMGSGVSARTAQAASPTYLDPSGNGGAVGSVVDVMKTPQIQQADSSVFQDPALFATCYQPFVQAMLPYASGGGSAGFATATVQPLVVPRSGRSRDHPGGRVPDRAHRQRQRPDDDRRDHGRSPSLRAACRRRWGR